MMEAPFSVSISEDDGRSVDATYDYTKASAINTCPVYGITRFTHHKIMHSAERLIAPEAGQAAHRGFAAVRLMQLGHIQKRPDLMLKHGNRIFGEAVWAQMQEVYSSELSFQSNVTNVAHEAVFTSGFVDDPSDRRRTVDNICELMTNYVNEWDFERWPVWIDKENVGIEIPFSFLVEFTDKDGKHRIRYTGRVDGIHTDPKNENRVTMHENKTASRMDSAWLAQWIMSHQITGYCIFASVYTKTPVTHALVLGSQLPVPKVASSGQCNTLVPRNQQKITDWCIWLYHTHQLHQKHKDNVLAAPRYTHSCNRYFRPCSFMALCDSPMNEQQKILAEMPVLEWNPLVEDIT